MMPCTTYKSRPLFISHLWSTSTRVDIIQYLYYNTETIYVRSELQQQRLSFLYAEAPDSSWWTEWHITWQCWFKQIFFVLSLRIWSIHGYGTCASSIPLESLGRLRRGWLSTNGLRLARLLSFIFVDTETTAVMKANDAAIRWRYFLWKVLAFDFHPTITIATWIEIGPQLPSRINRGWNWNGNVGIEVSYL